jgi:hypothetical protein
VRGAAGRAQLWALVFSPLPLHAGREVKIVWRMTGRGALSLYAESPAGERVAPGFGPDAHSQSTWDRPGDEWGSGFTFPAPGCWRVHASRVDASGDVWFLVEP